MFKLGDRIKNKLSGHHGTVVSERPDDNSFDVQYDGGVLACTYWHSLNPQEYIELVSTNGALAMPEPKSDVVSHPQHYNQGKIEVIEFIEDKKLNYHKGNAIKYISRAGIKNKAKEIEDLRKAIWYLQREIEQLIAKNENREAVKPNDMKK